MCHEAQNGEDYEAGVHTGGTVGYADDDAVSVLSEEELGEKVQSPPDICLCWYI